MTAVQRHAVEVCPTDVSGCHELLLSNSTDSRGSFVKLFQSSAFADSKVAFSLAELFVTTSARGVVRGLHFQLPPADGEKVVACVAGAAFDVVVDVRLGSPTYGRIVTLELSPGCTNAVFVPRGCAHGFASLTDGCVMVYGVSSEYDASCDSGIRWNSAGIEWPLDDPIVSARDAGLPPLAEFQSPFRYEDVR